MKKKNDMHIEFLCKQKHPVLKYLLQYYWLILISLTLIYIGLEATGNAFWSIRLAIIFTTLILLIVLIRNPMELIFNEKYTFFVMDKHYIQLGKRIIKTSTIQEIVVEHSKSKKVIMFNTIDGKVYKLQAHEFENELLLIETIERYAKENKNVSMRIGKNAYDKKSI